ncbi:hypothetical protein K8I61_16210 [bacterium]|nr:hypothetical protein [bacterium]
MTTGHEAPYLHVVKPLRRILFFAFLVVCLATSLTCSCGDDDDDAGNDNHDDDDTDPDDDSGDDDDDSDDGTWEDIKYAGWLISETGISYASSGQWGAETAIDIAPAKLTYPPREYSNTIYLFELREPAAVYALKNTVANELYDSGDDSALKSIGFFSVDEFFAKIELHPDEKGDAGYAIVKRTTAGVEVVSLAFDVAAFFQGFDGELYAHDGTTIYEYDGAAFNEVTIFDDGEFSWVFSRGDDFAAVLTDGRFAWRELGAWNALAAPAEVFWSFANANGAVVLRSLENSRYYRFDGDGFLEITGLVDLDCGGRAGILDDDAFVIFCEQEPLFVGCSGGSPSTFYEIVIAVDDTRSCRTNQFSTSGGILHIDGTLTGSYVYH